MRQRLQSDQGFTLIELLVVMVILGVIAAISIPAYLAQRESAYAASLTGDLRQLVVALHNVELQNGSYGVANGATEVSPLLVAAGYEGKSSTHFTVVSTMSTYCAEGRTDDAPGLVLVVRSDLAGVLRGATC